MTTNVTSQFSQWAVWCGVAGTLVACGSTQESAPGQNSSTTQVTTTAPAVVPNPGGDSSAPSVPPGTTSSASTIGPGETSAPSEPPAPSVGASSSGQESEPTSPEDMSSGETPAPGNGCTIGGWPTVDPAVVGPFETVTESNVGPAAGEGEDGDPVAFTVFRPSDLTASGRCHPVVTWGNGTGSNPGLYKVLLNHLASHGFIVVASDSPNVAQGDPPPMVAGVTWLVAENENPDSPYFQRVDTSHVGATGHSQGGFATTQAGADSHITTIAPLCGASPQRNLHGPALLLCGGADEVVDCEGIANALEAIDQPAMLANYITADHADWVTFRGTSLSPMEVATVAWMRTHLMDDVALRPWFYGPDCKLCTDEAWEITQKMMDE